MQVKIDRPTDKYDENCSSPKAEGGTHCECWWDGDACCYCGAPAMTEDEKREQGMIE